MTPNSVSVVIPAYNAESFIVDALDSLTRQTVLPDEVVIVDDGSKDGTSDAINAWKKSSLPGFPVHLIRQANGGLPVARNVGISGSVAKWIALLDADDIWEPDHLAVLLDAAAHVPDVVAAYGAGRLLVDGVVQQGRYDDYWDSPSRKLGVAVEGDSRYLKIDFSAFGRLVKGNFIKPSSLMFSREVAVAIGLFNEKLRTAEDREFLVRLLRAGDFVYAPATITQYRWHEDNISQGKNARRNSENALRALKLIAENAELQLGPDERQACEQVVGEAAVGYLYLSVREGRQAYLEGLRFLAGSFGWGLVLRSWRPKHLLRLIVRA